LFFDEQLICDVVVVGSRGAMSVRSSGDDNGDVGVSLFNVIVSHEPDGVL